MVKFEDAPDRVKGICLAFIGFAAVFLVDIFLSVAGKTKIALSDETLFYIILAVLIILSLFSAFYSLRASGDAYALSIVSATIMGAFGIAMMVNLNSTIISYMTLVIIAVFVYLMALSKSAREFYGNQ